MKKKLKIGWQKYEDLLEKQMSSPILQSIMKQMMSFADKENYEEIAEEESIEEEEYYEEYTQDGLQLLPISQQLLDEITMLSNFDCWIGHTNFDITKDIKNKLNTVEGIEVLKICSRYRFFIGIGKMFDFKEVRNNIEKTIIPQGD